MLDLFETLDSKEAIEPFISKALEKATTLKTQELFRYFPKVAFKKIEQGAFPLQISSTTPAELLLYSLEEGMRKYGAFIHNKIHEWIEKEENPLHFLPLLQKKGGYFVYVPPKKQIESPLKIEVKEGMGIIIFFVQKGASLSVVMNLAPQQGFTNVQVIACLEEGARLSFETLDTSAQTAFTTLGIRSMVKGGAHAQVSILSLSSSKRWYGVKSTLDGEHAISDASIVAPLIRSGEVHVHMRMEHVAPNTRSMQLYQTAVGSDAKSSFNGKIYVHEEAQKTEAYQLNNNLLLHPDAKAYTRPGLEIFADDVKASHGATTGFMKKEELFYFRSRGIALEEAKKLVMNGHLRAPIEEKASDFVRNEWIKTLKEYVCT